MKIWPFKTVTKLSQSGMLDGYTDWHSHILPGVDDGIKTMDEALETLTLFEEKGIKKIWFTPHVMEDCPNSTERLRERFDELKEKYKGNLELRLASENMLDSLFKERLDKKDFLTIGDKGEHLLIETSYVNPPLGMEEMIEGVFKIGLIPVLAHPERYRYMNEEDYLRWKGKGVLFQANYISLVGGYGETARKKLEWMLKNGLVDLTGSDVHRKFVFEHTIEKSPKHKDPLRQLLEVTKKPKL